MIKKVLITAVFIKIAIFTIIFLSFNLLPFNKASYYGNFIYPKNESVSLASAYKTWDAEHYLYLSQKGYKKNNLSDRFFPLFPAGIALVGLIVKNPVLAGLVAANVFSLIGAYYFFLFSKLLIKNEKSAFVSLLLLFSFPTAFYLSIIYSESLLFFLTAAFFYYLYTKKYFTAALFVFFIPMVRPVGILIAGPYFIHWFLIIRERSKKSVKTFVKNLFAAKQTYYLLSPLLGFVLYFIFMQLATGYYFEGFSAQNLSVGRWSLGNLFNPSLFLVNFFFPSPPAIHGFTNSLIDRLFFVVYLVSLVFIYKRLDKTMFVYSLLLGMVPVFGSFMSYTRYMLMVFPIFIVAAKMLEEKRNQMFYYSLSFFMIMFQALFLIMHSLNYWVA